MGKRVKELRQLDPSQLEEELQRTRKELMDVRSQLSSGGSIDDPGKIKEVKKTIARILTLQNEAKK